MRMMLCDDEPAVTAMLLKKLAARYPEAELLTFASGEALLSAPETGDIILMDVQMPTLGGIETAKALREKGCRAVIIFLTGREDKVFDAFEVEAFRYLVKPVSEETLFAAIDAAMVKLRGTESAQQEDKEKDILFTSNGQHVRVRFSDLIYAEVFNRLVSLHTVNGNFEYYGRLSELEEAAGEGFFRCHRSYLVNLCYVESYTAREITLRGGSAIMSKKKYPAFVRAYMAYIKGA